ncbi:hypothetical protein HYU19_05680 [Candidatus Woesearchaeota archaeon]|nr:hypothetical protein [Candidatus Woesearchaeota archaeon]
MAKTCIICDKNASFCVKGSSDLFYCHDCATDQFGDVTYLITVEEQAKQVMKAMEDAADSIQYSDNDERSEE